MDVATRLFVTQGYAETSLVDIAKRAGVATRTVYQHFGDKEAIFREVIYARRTSALMPLPAVRPGETLRAVLRRTADMAVDYVLAKWSVDLMRLMIAESRRFPELMKRVANATFSRFRANITSVFEQLADHDKVPDGNHAVSAQLFLDLILGNTPVMFYGDWQADGPPAEELDMKVDLFIQGRFGTAVIGVAKGSTRDRSECGPRHAANRAGRVATENIGDDERRRGSPEIDRDAPEVAFDHSKEENT